VGVKAGDPDLSDGRSRSDVRGRHPICSRFCALEGGQVAADPVGFGSPNVAQQL